MWVWGKKGSVGELVEGLETHSYYGLAQVTTYIEQCNNCSSGGGGGRGMFGGGGRLVMVIVNWWRVFVGGRFGGGRQERGRKPNLGGVNTSCT